MGYLDEIEHEDISLSQEAWGMLSVASKENFHIIKAFLGRGRFTYYHVDFIYDSFCDIARKEVGYNAVLRREIRDVANRCIELLAAREAA